MKKRHRNQASYEKVCEFLLVFDDGDFSELSTFTITDWFAHTPKDVLAANFGVPESAFAHIPTKQRYIFQTQVPGSLESQKVSDPYGTVPRSSHIGCLNRIRS